MDVVVNGKYTQTMRRWSRGTENNKIVKEEENKKIRRENNKIVEEEDWEFNNKKEIQKI